MMRLISGAMVMGLLCAGAGAAPPKKHPAAKPADAPAPEPVALTNIQMRLNALGMLRDMHATKAQMTAMKKIAAQTAEPARTREEPKYSPAVEQAMHDAHAAVLHEKDEEKVEAALQQLDKVLESENVEFDDDVELTESARQHAGEIAKMLSASQVASLIAVNEEHVKDPGELLWDTLHESHKLKGEEWDDARDSAAEDAAVLADGINGSKTNDLTEKYKAWLDESHGLDEAQLRGKRAQLLQSAAKIGGESDWGQVMRNWVEYSMAELLANPELSVALNERLR